MTTKQDEKRLDEFARLIKLKRQESKNSERNSITHSITGNEDVRKSFAEPDTPTHKKMDPTLLPLPEDVTREILLEQNNHLREQLIKLQCSFEAEKFSSQYYSSKIEKEFQQILFENHHLRKTITNMNITIRALTKIIKQSMKMYLNEREKPPENGLEDSEDDLYLNDPQFLPIEGLQDKIEQLLLDYRETVSMFSETNALNRYSFKRESREYEGFHSRNTSEGKKMSSIRDSKRVLKNSLIKKTSIYSGSFGKNKFNSNGEDDFKAYQEAESAQNVEEKEAEDLIFENERIRWVPNDAYDHCQV